MLRPIFLTIPFIFVVALVGLAPISIASESKFSSADPLTGSRVNLETDWVGSVKVSPSLPILVLAGHADSQGLDGAGTAGEAVDLKGEEPMDLSISDELYWNLKLRDKLVSIGRNKGLNISSYDPPLRQIYDENDPRTNWSVGALHSKNGGYAFEIHFDSYGNYGFGSGLIPAISTKLNTLDESLAQHFGRYPRLFRGGLGAPKRRIRILEIGKLGGRLEEKLRDESTRDETLTQLALKIVKAIEDGLGKV